MTGLRVIRAGPSVTVQDMGRPGLLAYGLSRGGAMDRLAPAEGAALLGQNSDLAALEMAGFGGVFEAEGDLRIALTGAPMAAEIDGERVAWNACHALPKGERLSIGGAMQGVYGYLSIGGGLDTPIMLGSRAAHIAAGIGRPLAAGDFLAAGADPRPDKVGLGLRSTQRFGGGTVRVIPGPQTALFSAEVLERFGSEVFRRDARGNRMGVRLLPQGDGFATNAGLSIMSEIVVPGDIQVTGEGTPFVLMAECQTTGGYPRIGTVLPTDLPIVAQAGPGATLCFVWVDLETAENIEAAERKRIRSLGSEVFPLIRDPSAIPDLLSYQLISGATAGDDLEREDEWS
ncbi:MAG: biotin-dependent carboxyltransferase [Alphaproteobacteria bacterium]|nr:MAG: biotin-dependent carboxyltransferase [Alphaproteobacteria bacterium]